MGDFDRPAVQGLVDRALPGLGVMLDCEGCRDAGDDHGAKNSCL
jgi:hypothetical protein